MSECDVFRAALIRAGQVLEHLAEFSLDATSREQAREALSAPVRAEVERMRVLERMAEAVRGIVEPGVGIRVDDCVGELLEALDELEGLERGGITAGGITADGEIHDKKGVR